MGWVVLFLLFALAGCEKKPESSAPAGGAQNGAEETSASSKRNQKVAASGPQPSDPQSSDAKQEEKPPSQESDWARSPYRFPAAPRVVAIGDLHGDIAATRKVFELASAMDSSGHWVGGELVVVQTGDQLDRGDGEREILNLLERLQREARAAGGRLVVLNGNHEAMNVLGDFRYVTREALDDFSGLEPSSPYAQEVEGPARSRAQAFLPGGAMALRLAKRPIVAQVGETVFVHGGVTPKHINYGISRMNREVGRFMRGKRTQPPSPMVDPEGPLWTRIYSQGKVNASTCAVLEKTLRLMGAQRLVVGHTVQRGGISSSCDERVFRIDVGLSNHYGGRELQVLEIRGDQTKVLSRPR